MQSWTPAPRHKVFISFHHAGDYRLKELFLAHFAEAIIDYSVRTGEIPDNAPTEYVRQKIRDEYIRDATVTIVLIGHGTWRRKHVDWEIDSSLRDTSYNPRTGLMGILLPSYSQLSDILAGGTYPHGVQLPHVWSIPRRQTFSANNIPPRLWDNVQAGFAVVRPWPRDSHELREWIHEAFVRRDENPPPNLSRARFGSNRSDTQPYWTD